MARKKATRKFQLTFNNPQTHGFTHERIRSILEQFPGLEYWCMCDETGEQGTPHTHLYMASKNAIQYETIHRRFYGVHVEAANGSHRENRDYIRKEGKWLDDAKHETNHPETFEEWGELPTDKGKSETQAEQIMQMVIDGKSNAEILHELPTAYSKLNYIEQARQTLLEAQYKDKWRELHTVYIWGETGAGKTRSIMEQHGYSKVYRVTDYAHPFDNYKGQDVILFPSPVRPDKISHAYLADLPLLITSEKVEGAGKIYDAYPETAPYRPGDKALFDALTEKASAAMAQASTAAAMAAGAGFLYASTARTRAATPTSPRASGQEAIVLRALYASSAPE